MKRLDELEAQSVSIWREAYNRLQPMVVLWSRGKDSTTLLWLARKAFFGHVPFPVLHLDAGKAFNEMAEFQERYGAEWNLDLRNEECPPVEAVDDSLPPAARAAARRSLGLKNAIQRDSLKGVVVGIRRDEHPVRAKERLFSPRSEGGQWDFRDQPPEFWDQYNTEFPPDSHIRVHPLLGWTELDVWRYIEREKIPLVPLYFARGGKRYRSLGDEDNTSAIKSDAATVSGVIAELEGTTTPERAGRAMDHESEDAFERLRADGYL